MTTKTTWITGALAVLAASSALMSLPAQAQASINLQIGAPPPVRYEVAPQPRRGYDWVPGHWEWRRNQHIWVAGYYLRARPGYYYQEPIYVQQGSGWAYRGGGWQRGERGRGDRDHDGIPNRRDHDRDGDGVPNRFDNAPNNPNRR